ncbi:hypothetical protein RHSIM_Rhsim12G0097600 [Rhododendron simsii]|uniref:Leucine-rich repeat-containing N-terminal plant-type domain-containing protein n=1 Tax=Rhododendron simsii TaxID=118357 RepID=A0A834G3J7_RHOSS|nr:hypothetical protein RHSIM_Rhsim12G0097600 [Rhododendron simsii]
MPQSDMIKYPFDLPVIYYSCSMRSQTLIFVVFALAVVTAECNSEVDGLYAWKIVLVDPNNVLQSWDPTVKSPCTWFHITCNSLNSVVRVDLGDAGLSGPLVPHLGDLDSLQYLEVYGNNLSGSIPRELGKLFHLISLDLYNNQLSGHIPPTLGKLKSLKFMNVSDNQLAGSVQHHTNITGIPWLFLNGSQ